ncbi:MAG: hypothetical protein V3U84_02960 [Thiotrichaceae bacterium]
MIESFSATRTQLSRQVEHWSLATSRLGDLDNLASPNAWSGLEQYLGTAIRQRLNETVTRLQWQVNKLRADLKMAHNETALKQVQLQLVNFRKSYLRTETTLDFYADAITVRNNPRLEPLLRACDSLAYRSLKSVLDQLDKPTPLILTYLDKGLGASILKAGLRLWDQHLENPAAAIKIVNHNLYRPTALIHETGHQFAHIVGWNAELAETLDNQLTNDSLEAAEVWSSWSSEIAADAFAFVHTGYASVVGLHDVLSGGDRFVFRYRLGDPHPISYIRVLLGTEMCRQFYGTGPWDDMASAWIKTYSLQKANSSTRELLQQSVSLLPKVVDIALRTPMRSFGGRPLTALVDPMRVSPESLIRLEQTIGPALYTSMHWVWTESIRLLALTGLKVATMPEKAAEALEQQQAWMLRLGDTLKAA